MPAKKKTSARRPAPVARKSTRKTPTRTRSSSVTGEKLPRAASTGGTDGIRLNKLDQPGLELEVSTSGVRIQVKRGSTVVAVALAKSVRGALDKLPDPWGPQTVGRIDKADRAATERADKDTVTRKNAERDREERERFDREHPDWKVGDAESTRSGVERPPGVNA